MKVRREDGFVQYLTDVADQHTFSDAMFAQAARSAGHHRTLSCEEKLPREMVQSDLLNGTKGGCVATAEYSVESHLCKDVAASKADNQLTGKFRLVAFNRERV